MMDRNEIEVPTLQARVGLQREVEVLRHMPGMPLQGEHQEEADPVITREKLSHLYWGEKKSLQKISNEVRLSTTQIHYWMVKWGIPRRTQSEAEKLAERSSKIPHGDIERMYCAEKMSTTQIAGLMGCSRKNVVYWMKKLGIPRRTLPEAAKLRGNRFMITREKLEQMYLDKKMTTERIGELLGCANQTVSYWMKKFGISSRQVTPPVRFNEPNINPSNDLAYILGVLKGDGCVHIPVRHTGPRTGHVILNQTRAEFAKSFENAVKRIGLPAHTHIYRKKSDHLTNNPKPMFVTCSHSIKFAQWYKQLSLVDIEKLIGDNPEFIKEFIRGFYESEGSNYIRPRYKTSIKWEISMTNADLDLLRLVKRLLTKLGFVFHLRCHGMGNIPCSRTHSPIYRLRSGIQRQHYTFMKEIAPCIKNSFPVHRNQGVGGV